MSDLRAERGMTIVEVIVASVLLLAGILAAFSVLIGSRDATTTAEKLEVATHIAERELERMQTLRWANLAHPTTPASGPAPHLVAPVAGVPSYLWKPPASREPLALDATNGQVGATATTVNDGRLSVTVWRYVSWVNDAAVNPSTADFKRLTVVVRLNQPTPPPPAVLTSYAARKEGF